MLYYDPENLNNPFGSKGWYVPSDLWNKYRHRTTLTAEQRYNLSSAPGLGWILRAQDNQKYINDYMRSRNLIWDDMKYPSIAPGSGSAFQPINQVLTLSATARFLYR